MDWLRDNVTWVKDILTVGFSLVLVAVAVLTYRRARETLLQPVRSQVIKHQADIMAQALEFVTRSQAATDESIDYITLCSVNAFQWLDEYGFVLANHKEQREKTRPFLAGFLFVGEDKIIRDAEVVQPFVPSQDELTEQDHTDWRRLRYEKAKSGDVDDVEVDRVFLTKRHIEYQQQLDGFLQSPFLPSSTLGILQDFKRNIHYNLTVAIRDTIAEFIAELMTRSHAQDAPNPVINRVGVYNMFNRKRLTHRDTLARLQDNIRKYLKVYSMP